MQTDRTDDSGIRPGTVSGRAGSREHPIFSKGMLHYTVIQNLTEHYIIPAKARHTLLLKTLRIPGE